MGRTLPRTTITAPACIHCIAFPIEIRIYDRAYDSRDASMHLCNTFTILATALAVCADDGDGRYNARLAKALYRNQLAIRSQEGATLPPEQKLRELEWGHLNFLHITDTHGWESGRPGISQYSADWGDLVAFSEHLKHEADRRNVDYLVIETGDRHDGTGLSDATDLDGSVSQLILGQQDFDVLSIGNHELYTQQVALQEYNLLRPYYGDHYLSSNVEIYINDNWVAAGKKYRKFETKNLGIRILAFGFLFDFAGFANGTRVITVEEEIKKDWFRNVVSAKDYDVVLVTGHMPVRDFDEIGAIVSAIREINPNVPIQGFGGHTHLRDYRVFDDNAVALESGRYLETVGWASLKLPKFNWFRNKNCHFSRRYIDFNVQNFAYHTGKTLDSSGPKSFYTKKGNAVTQMIAEYRSSLSLNTELATIPQDYWTDRAPYPSNDSLFTLAEEGFLHSLQGDVGRDSLPRYVYINSGAFRYDLLAGAYTLDSKFIVSPFDNDWLYLKDVPIDIANQVLDHLNNDYSYIRKRDFNFDPWPHFKFNPWSKWHTDPENHGDKSLIAPAPEATTPAFVPPHSSDTNPVYKGYVTSDDFGSDGDDTPHDSYTFYGIPNAIQSAQNTDGSAETVDVIFLSFLDSYITPYVAGLGGPSESELYGGKLIRDLIEDYFKAS